MGCIAYEMPSAEGAKCPRESSFYMPYILSAYVATIIPSVCGLRASVRDFQKFDEAI